MNNFSLIKRNNKILLNRMKKVPPMMGSGMERNTAPTFVNKPNKIIITAVTCTTTLLPTCSLEVKTYYKVRRNS